MPARSILPISGLLFASLCAAGRAVAEADEAWLDDFEERAAAVNEGELRFLRDAPEQAAHHHHNTLTLLPESLDTGWAQLEQCHQHLDAVPRAEIAFHPGRVRGITIRSQTGIDRIWVEGSSVQLEDVHPGARLCLRTETRALRLGADGIYHLLNGPFMRRFLDGYYPMRVSMDVILPRDCLSFGGIEPAPRPGFRVWEGPGSVHFEAWFEGRLYTRMQLEPTRAEGC